MLVSLIFKQERDCTGAMDLDVANRFAVPGLVTSIPGSDQPFLITNVGNVLIMTLYFENVLFSMCFRY